LKWSGTGQWLILPDRASKAITLLSGTRLIDMAQQGVDHPTFSEFKRILDVAGVDCKIQTEKCEKFFRSAYTSLNTHFSRWVSQTFLPMSLMSELLFAMVVTRVVLWIPREFTESMSDAWHPNYVYPYKSGVHKCCIVCTRFKTWLNEQVKKDFGKKKTEELFPQHVIEGARCVLYSTHTNMLWQIKIYIRLALSVQCMLV
jgi:hypothetical protein